MRKALAGPASGSVRVPTKPSPMIVEASSQDQRSQLSAHGAKGTGRSRRSSNTPKGVNAPPGAQQGRSPIDEASLLIDEKGDGASTATSVSATPSPGNSPGMVGFRGPAGGPGAVSPRSGTSTTVTRTTSMTSSQVSPRTKHLEHKQKMMLEQQAEKVLVEKKAAALAALHAKRLRREKTQEHTAMLIETLSLFFPTKTEGGGSGSSSPLVVVVPLNVVIAYWRDAFGLQDETIAKTLLQLSLPSKEGEDAAEDNNSSPEVSPEKAPVLDGEEVKEGTEGPPLANSAERTGAPPRRENRKKSSRTLGFDTVELRRNQHKDGLEFSQCCNGSDILSRLEAIPLPQIPHLLGLPDSILDPQPDAFDVDFGEEGQGPYLSTLVPHFITTGHQREEAPAALNDAASDMKSPQADSLLGGDVDLPPLGDELSLSLPAGGGGGESDVTTMLHYLLHKKSKLDGGRFVPDEGFFTLAKKHQPGLGGGIGGATNRASPGTTLLGGAPPALGSMAGAVARTASGISCVSSAQPHSSPHPIPTLFQATKNTTTTTCGGGGLRQQSGVSSRLSMTGTRSSVAGGAHHQQATALLKSEESPMTVIPLPARLEYDPDEEETDLHTSSGSSETEEESAGKRVGTTRRGEEAAVRVNRRKRRLLLRSIRAGGGENNDTAANAAATTEMIFLVVKQPKRKLRYLNGVSQILLHRSIVRSLCCCSGSTPLRTARNLIGESSRAILKTIRYSVDTNGRRKEHLTDEVLQMRSLVRNGARQRHKNQQNPYRVNSLPNLQLLHSLAPNWYAIAYYERHLAASILRQTNIREQQLLLPGPGDLDGGNEGHPTLTANTLSEDTAEMWNRHFVEATQPTLEWRLALCLMENPDLVRRFAVAFAPRKDRKHGKTVAMQTTKLREQDRRRVTGQLIGADGCNDLNELSRTTTATSPASESLGGRRTDSPLPTPPPELGRESPGGEKKSPTSAAGGRMAPSDYVNFFTSKSRAAKFSVMTEEERTGHQAGASRRRARSQRRQTNSEVQRLDDQEDDDNLAATFTGGESTRSSDMNDQSMFANMEMMDTISDLRSSNNTGGGHSRFSTTMEGGPLNRHLGTTGGGLSPRQPTLLSTPSGCMIPRTTSGISRSSSRAAGGTRSVTPGTGTLADDDDSMVDDSEEEDEEDKLLLQSSVMAETLGDIAQKWPQALPSARKGRGLFALAFLEASCRLPTFADVVFWAIAPIESTDAFTAAHDSVARTQEQKNDLQQLARHALRRCIDIPVCLSVFKAQLQASTDQLCLDLRLLKNIANANNGNGGGVVPRTLLRSLSVGVCGAVDLEGLHALESCCKRLLLSLGQLATLLPLYVQVSASSSGSSSSAAQEGADAKLASLILTISTTIYDTFLGSVYGVVGEEAGPSTLADGGSYVLTFNANPLVKRVRALAVHTLLDEVLASKLVHAQDTIRSRLLDDFGSGCMKLEQSLLQCRKSWDREAAVQYFKTAARCGILRHLLLPPSLSQHATPEELQIQKQRRGELQKEYDSQLRSLLFEHDQRSLLVLYLLSGNSFLDEDDDDVHRQHQASSRSLGDGGLVKGHRFPPSLDLLLSEEVQFLYDGLLQHEIPAEAASTSSSSGLNQTPRRSDGQSIDRVFEVERLATVALQRIPIFSSSSPSRETRHAMETSSSSVVDFAKALHSSVLGRTLLQTILCVTSVLGSRQVVRQRGGTRLVEFPLQRFVEELCQLSFPSVGVEEGDLRSTYPSPGGNVVSGVVAERLLLGHNSTLLTTDSFAPCLVLSLLHLSDAENGSGGGNSCVLAPWFEHLSSEWRRLAPPKQRPYVIQGDSEEVDSCELAIIFSQMFRQRGENSLSTSSSSWVESLQRMETRVKGLHHGKSASEELLVLLYTHATAKGKANHHEGDDSTMKTSAAEGVPDFLPPRSHPDWLRLAQDGEGMREFLYALSQHSQKL